MVNQERGVIRRRLPPDDLSLAPRHALRNTKHARLLAREGGATVFSTCDIRLKSVEYITGGIELGLRQGGNPNRCRRNISTRAGPLSK